MTENFERKDFVLAAAFFRDKHTGLAILAKFDEICAEFGIEESRRFAVVADGAANMKKAMNFLQYFHCSIHRLQLCIGVSRAIKFYIVIWKLIVGLGA